MNDEKMNKFDFNDDLEDVDEFSDKEFIDEPISLQGLVNTFLSYLIIHLEHFIKS